MSRTTESHNPAKRAGRIRIFKAVPKGSTRAKSQAGWIRALDTHLAELVDLGELRSDAAGNIRAIAWVIARHAHWSTFVTRPGWDTLTDRTRLSRSTVQRAVRRLREWGFLGVVSSGSTWWTRGGRHDDRDGNQGAEYVLTIPAQEPVEISDSPSLGSRREPEKPHVCARENQTPTVSRSEKVRADRPWPMTRPTATRQDRLAAAKRLQAEAPMLRRITPQLLRHVLRPQLTAGWTVTDILHALDHTPDGEQHWHTGDVRHVAAWVRHRLKAWAGQPAPKPVAARQSMTLTAADVAALPRPDAAPVADTATHASRARQMLAATLKRRSDKPVWRGLGVLLPDRDGEIHAPAAVEPAAEPPTASGDGDWLLRNAARRAEPDLMRAFSRLGATA